MKRTSKRNKVFKEKKIEKEMAKIDSEFTERLDEEDVKEQAAIYEETNESVSEKKFHSGLWSEQENLLLLESLKKYKWGDWSLISEYIGTRTPSQVSKKVRDLYLSKNKIKKGEELNLICIQMYRDYILGLTEKSNANENTIETSNFEPNKVVNNDDIVMTEPEKDLIEDSEEVKDIDNREIQSNHEEVINEPHKNIESSITPITKDNHELKTDLTKTNSIDAEPVIETQKFFFTVPSVHNDIEVLIDQNYSGIVESEVFYELQDESLETEIIPDLIRGPTVLDSKLRGVEIDLMKDLQADQNALEFQQEKFAEILDAKPVVNSETNSSNVDTVDPFSLSDSKSPSKSRKLLPRPVPSSKTVPAKSPKKSTSNSILPATIKKRTYTRKNAPRSFTPINVGEEVSILSSSSSAGSSIESINIMSSSDSNVSTTNSRDKSRSNSISLSNSSSESFSSSKTIEEWERKACPAIFERTIFQNADKVYLKYKSKIVKLIKNHPEFTREQVIKAISQQSVKSTQQILNILGFKSEESPPFSYSSSSSSSSSSASTLASISVTPFSTPSISKSNKKSLTTNYSAEVNFDYEVLKKLSLSSSGRKRKIRSEEGDWIDPNEIEGRVISHEPVTPSREKRKRKPVRKEMFTDDLSSREDPFRLILLNDFEAEVAPAPVTPTKMRTRYSDGLKAPFRVEMCTSVILLMDIHSHLHSSEIIGLLGGSFNYSNSNNNSKNISDQNPCDQNSHDFIDSRMPVLKINFGYPCSTVHSTGTQVDVDPLSEMEAGQFFESKNVRMTGWYHSHPNFEPNPSIRDLETQIMYQGLFKNSQPGSNIEPFVGVIVNPYLAITELSSHIECFYVVPNTNLSDDDRIPYRLPINRIPFDSDSFPDILIKMKEILFQAESSTDRLDMQKSIRPGLKRIDQLFRSLQFHGNLNESQMEQIKGLFK